MDVDSMAFNVVIVGCGDKNVCEKCHLPSFTNKDTGYYCQVYKCMVSAQS
jgi:hypothetical protein